MDTPQIRRMSRRRFLGSSAIAASLLTAGLGWSRASAEDAGELIVLGWSVYWPPEMIALFKKLTGINLKIIGADTDQDMFTKLQAGGAGEYDVVYANAGWTPLYHKSGLIEPIALADFPDATKNLYSQFYSTASLPFVLEPGKTLLFYPNSWSPMALLWRPDIVKPDGQPSWSMMWNSNVPRGTVILSMGAGDDYLAIGGLATGVPKDQLYSMNADQLAQVVTAMRKLKPFQMVDGVPDLRARFRTDKATIGLVGQLGAAAQINDEAGKHLLDIAIPKEGSLGWVDGAMLIKGAKNRANALKMMDFMGSNLAYLRLLLENNGSSLCSRTGTEAIIAAGGADAATLKQIEGDHPEIVEQVVMQAPPTDPAAYSAAWDKVVAG